MNTFYSSIYLVGIVLQVAILWRTKRAGLWSHYPVLICYVSYCLMESLLVALVIYFARGHYSFFYWNDRVVSLIFHFVVCWEVARRSFSQIVSLHSLPAAILAVTILASSIVFWGACLGLAGVNRFGATYPVFERIVDLIQAGSFLFVLLVARYYHIRLGRNLRGIAIAFGAYLSISSISFGLVEVGSNFYAYWEALFPLSVILLFSILMWAVWNPVPNPMEEIGAYARK